MTNFLTNLVIRVLSDIMKLIVQASVNAGFFFFFFFFFSYGCCVPSSGNSLRMLIKRFSYSSSQFVVKLTWPTSWEGERVEATCLREDLRGVKK
jgi:hypothetical protein